MHAISSNMSSFLQTEFLDIIIPIIRAVMVLCILPLFVTIYQWGARATNQADAAPTERTSLLAHRDPETAPSSNDSIDTYAVVWKQELLITRGAMLLSLMGIAHAFFLRDWIHFLFGTSPCCVMISLAHLDIQSQPSQPPVFSLYHRLFLWSRFKRILPN